MTTWTSKRSQVSDYLGFDKGILAGEEGGGGRHTLTHVISIIYPCTYVCIYTVFICIHHGFTNLKIVLSISYVPFLSLLELLSADVMTTTTTIVIR